MSAPVFEGQRDKLDEIVKLMKDAQKPLVLIGGGIISANASEELMNFMDATGIPVARTLMAKSAIPDRHPLSLGMMGLYGSRTANYAANRADLIIVIGCRFSDRTVPAKELLNPRVKIAHINVDAKEIGENIDADIAVVGDAKLVLNELLARVRDADARCNDEAWANNLKRFKEIEFSEDISGDSEPISAKRVFHDLRKFIRDEDIVVTGVGNHQMMADHYIDRKYPRTFITSGGEGTMGFGLPASIGVKVAKPEARVFNIDGDGSFQMTMEELGVLAYENLKVITVIFKNEYLGMVRQWQEKVYGHDRYSAVHLGAMPNLAKVAEAYGLLGIRVTKPQDIAAALEKAIADPRASVIEIVVAQEENYLPSPLKVSEDKFS